MGVELVTYLNGHAEVYRFGARWHWKCSDGRCLGGPKRTHQDAVDAATTHVRDEHIRLHAVVVDGVTYRRPFLRRGSWLSMVSVDDGEESVEPAPAEVLATFDINPEESA
jgi:hypothetical protein